MGMSVGWATVGIDPDICINVGYRKREIETLNNRVIDLMDDSSQLLSLKVAELGYAPTKEDLKNLENARKRAEEAINNPEGSKLYGFKFVVDKKGRPAFDKRGFPQIELEYKKDENGENILDENGQPIPLVEFKKDKRGRFLFDSNGYPIPVKPIEEQTATENNNEEIPEGGEILETEVVDPEDDGKERLPKEVLEKAENFKKYAQ